MHREQNFSKKVEIITMMRVKSREFKFRRHVCSTDAGQPSPLPLGHPASVANICCGIYMFYGTESNILKMVAVCAAVYQWASNNAKCRNRKYRTFCLLGKIICTITIIIKVQVYFSVFVSNTFTPEFMDHFWWVLAQRLIGLWRGTERMTEASDAAGKSKWILKNNCHYNKEKHSNTILSKHNNL